MNNCSKYVGLDVHKETIVAAIAKAGRGDAMQYGEIDNTAEAILSRTDFSDASSDGQFEDLNVMERPFSESDSTTFPPALPVTSSTT